MRVRAVRPRRSPRRPPPNRGDRPGRAEAPEPGPGRLPSVAYQQPLRAQRLRRARGPRGSYAAPAAGPPGGACTSSAYIRVMFLGLNGPAGRLALRPAAAGPLQSLASGLGPAREWTRMGTDGRRGSWTGEVRPTDRQTRKQSQADRDCGREAGRKTHRQSETGRQIETESHEHR